MARFQIYALTEPGGGNPRYVGQTAQPLATRLDAHLRGHGSSRRAAWIRSLTAKNQRPGISILEEVDGSRQDAYAREAYWVRDLRAHGHNLLNVP